MAEGIATNVKVMVRVRPFSSREVQLSKKAGKRLNCAVRMRGNTCAVLEHAVNDQGFTVEKEREAFTFDCCFWSVPMEQEVEPSVNPFAKQIDVYRESGQIALDAAFDGFNTCIFAYGQTGSGKTHSMLGNEADPGVSPRLVDELFERITARQRTIPTTKCQVEVTFFEIYNEKVRDLFFDKKKVTQDYEAPRIRQDKVKGVFVEGLKRHDVNNAKVTKDLMEHGVEERAMAPTKMNQTSSRSHAVFQIQLTQLDGLKGTQKVSTINLVDLAGSERVKLSEVTGDSFTEAKNINQSLSTLRRVIDTLIENSTSKKQKPPPFREAVLTYLLSDSLGGNSKTMMISAVSPHESNVEDTLGTLRYAQRAKAIVCNARVNEEKSAALMDTMRDEIMALRLKLASGESLGPGQMMLPEDIQREIAEKEAEMHQMEETQHQMEVLIEQQKRETAIVQEKLDEAATIVSTQKRERFAAAFRNAFLIAQDKKKIEMSTKELDEARDNAAMYKVKFGDAEAELSSVRGDLARLEDRLSQSEEQLTRERATAAEQITVLNRVNKALGDDKNALQRRIDDMNMIVERAEALKRETEARMQYMQDDMLSMSRKMEQLAIEKSSVVERLETEAREASLSAEEMRRRKDNYKLRVAESDATVAGYKGQIAELEKDRSQLLATIKAQQQLLSERSSLIEQLNDQARLLEANERKAAADLELKNKEVKILLEALKEYENAAGKWMSEHTQKERELAHFRMHTDPMSFGRLPTTSSSVMTVGAGNVFSPNSSKFASAASPIRHATPRRAQSPSLSAIRSPIAMQPKVDRTPQRASSPVVRWS